MKLKMKISAFIMSFTLLAMSFLVSSSQVDVNAAARAETVNTSQKNEGPGTKEAETGRKASSDNATDVSKEEHSDVKVNLTKKEYDRIQKFISTVSSLYKWSVFTSLGAAAFLGMFYAAVAVGLPSVALLNAGISLGLVFTGNLVTFIKALEVGLSF